MSAKKITSTVKVNGESALNGVNCITERISPQPHTVTLMQGECNEYLKHVDQALLPLPHLSPLTQPIPPPLTARLSSPPCYSIGGPLSFFLPHMTLKRVLRRLA